MKSKKYKHLHSAMYKKQAGAWEREIIGIRRMAMARMAELEHYRATPWLKPTWSIPELQD